MAATSLRRRVALGASAITFVAVTGFSLTQSAGMEVSQLIANGTFVAVGGLIAVRRPANVIGPLMVAAGLLFQVTLALKTASEVAVADGDLSRAGWLAVLAEGPIGNMGIAMVVALVFLFPNGRTESPWNTRLLALALFLAVASVVLGPFAAPSAFDEAGTLPHPFLDDSSATTYRGVLVPLVIGLGSMMLVAAGMLVGRLRRAGPVERRQIGWLASAVGVYGLIIVPALVFNETGSLSDAGFLLADAIGFTLIPIALGVAIFRYRLYEIDRIVSRSVTFGALALFIGGVYVAIVVGVGELLGGDAGFGLSVVASVLVAMAFQPVRRRVARWANRLVYGERASPYEVLVRFSRRSAELSDEELLKRIPQLIVDGTGAASAKLWTRSGDGFRVAAVWPEDSVVREIEPVEGFVDGEADFSLPVVHDGELLGGLSLVKAGGDVVTPADEVLLGDLAAGLGLSLRNARLTGSLRRQVAELEASRERVLAAADAARRALENDLDSGPQQQLVALKVKLGPMRVLAERAGADKTAKLLGQLEVDAGEAIKAVREFAGGIYPPLLEAEGLMVAIGSQARKAPFPVQVHGDGVGRYSREVEAAVYFSVLEALQNTAKYAEATNASVTLSDADGQLSFEVRDDGRGFDVSTMTPGAGLSGISDRLDTVGGQVSIDSKPWSGTVVTGTLPITQPDTSTLEPA